ncbi:sensor histidine kinase [Cohnella faecalis]|nr:histidine kinase [Cohnella faecalis]
MSFWQSVRFKIVFGFALIIAPLVAFLIYNNVYATGVVRNQISNNYNKLLAVSVNENDKILKEYRYYLLRLARDPDIPIIQSYPSDSDEYILAKLRLLNRYALDSLLDSTSIYGILDTLFLYPRKEQSIIFATQYNTNSEEKETTLNEWSRTHLTGPIEHDYRWESITVEGGYHYLLKAVDLDLNVYAGALVPSDSMMRVLSNFDVGPSGAALLLDSSGVSLTSRVFKPMEDPDFFDAVTRMNDSYKIVRSQGENYLVMAKHSQYADLNYVLITPESYILKSLPFFQKVLYIWIPLLVALLLSFYLLFLQRVVFKPLVELIRGMRKLGQGRLDIRLPTNQSSEFAFMSGSFNQMAEQIEKLKIDVYEEQLRVQKAEYKHLQVQINPHFYMNSLNIIYNLAALKDFKSVQKLSLHLADYFRFLMQSNRPVVSLEDEIRHIGHYLEIQKVRYVTKLDFEIDVKPEHLKAEISPLTIQPFVENSVIHAFNKRVQDGSLFRIAIRSEDGEDELGSYVVITVSDNGPGFPEDMLRDLGSDAYLAGTGEQHLGIWNILRRFRMLYGDAGRIVFRNADEGGAVVEIWLPAAFKLPVGRDEPLL